MKLQFTPEDFCERPEDKECTHGDGNNWCAGMYLAGVANARLAEMLKDAPTLYGFQGDGWTSIEWGGDEFLHTHRARLVCIEEIVYHRTRPLSKKELEELEKKG